MKDQWGQHMRYNYPISSDELKDEMRGIYLDMVNLIGYVPASGETYGVASGVYDYLDDEVDELKEEVADNTVNKSSFMNILRSKTNIKYLKG